MIIYIDTLYRLDITLINDIVTKFYLEYDHLSTVIRENICNGRGIPKTVTSYSGLLSDLNLL